MIKVFGQTDKNFTSNGDIVLRPIKAKIRKEDNGDYFLTLETDLSYIDYFVEGNIVVANDTQGEQAFRIGNVIKTKNRLTSKCYHVFYDSKNYLIADSYVVDKNCNDALAHLNAATEPQSEFSTISDVATINSFRCVRKSLYEAIQTILERWGGHLIRDNFGIAIRSTIGTDNGVTIQYKKNLKEITCEENWDSVCTKILPVGKDEIMLNSVDPTASIYVTSEHQYALPYTKTVTFAQDDVNSDDYPTEAAYKQALVDDLRRQAIKYLEVNSYPQVNYTIKANLEKVTDIGDIVQVFDERLGVTLLTAVIAYEYDCIAQKYTEVEFGNFKQTINGLVGNLTASFDQELTTQVQQSTDSILGILGDSYVIYDGSQILVLDALPKGSATDVMRINTEGVSFSHNGINGAFTKALDVDGTLDMSALSVVGLFNIMTAGLSADKTTLATNIFTAVPLDISTKIGSKLTLQNDGGIKIGAGVSKILISAKAEIQSAAAAGVRLLRIMKNSNANTNVLAWTQENFAASETKDLVITPLLCNVTENDIIYLWYSVPNANDTIKGDENSASTMLTVSVIS